MKKCDRCGQEIGIFHICNYSTPDERENEIASLRARLAESEAGRARFEGAMILIEQITSPVGSTTFPTPTAWGIAKAALTGPSALEAVKAALGRLRDIGTMSYDMNAKADAAEAERVLRAAFFLGDGG